ncbi:predicted tRNA(5-methylaminomethyl-2-thiouridylate) methyltransferase [Pelotomaculum thermopropionicum SI]|uniref:tRNA-specific 2-thiouridylase MnmA n=1 Tax=Pelotomaculum thermopropionicum (strain DSM 13744 / JCM 10971 / SI) TaxID=370438 RepID=MNMA_PELTS|nr:RecName: Full=tRNA-specific 2-thiouridylase MnmA [Pelotomaculum thermopropionicum SI]BAF59237.1 predicted tRNA(5-methylaminomethyl-2-thiouridylate) methyltransferase [Pelotomaculum thermopropionicum SI]
MEKTKVVVAMSGGVDSSVTAALLLEQGFEVIGITMQIWNPGEEAESKGERTCCSLTAIDDARRVADKLGISHYVLNFRSIFEEKVIDYFTSEYLRGRTPNPCIACNRYVKFEALLDRALSIGAEYIATGHYARLGYSGEYGRYTVRRPVDRRKDQTYVLYGMTQRQIARTMMPLGNYTKGQVRKIAEDFGLPVAGKAESQEICFILDDDYRRFLREKAAGIKPGPFLNMKGEVIGRHNGIPFYTVGQRRGLGLAAGERLYVVKIDPENNAITLGPEEAVWGRSLIAADVNLILYESLEEPLEVEAQVRYNARTSPATLVPLPEGRVGVHFHTPQRSITPGQAVVFYRGDYLIGGATIESTGDFFR